MDRTGLRDYRRKAAPVRRKPGVIARVYSGEPGEARVRRREHAPLTMVDVALEPRTAFEQEMPATNNGFVYVLDGGSGWATGHGSSWVRWDGWTAPVAVSRA